MYGLEDYLVAFRTLFAFVYKCGQTIMVAVIVVA